MSSSSNTTSHHSSSDDEELVLMAPPQKTPELLKADKGSQTVSSSLAGHSLDGEGVLVSVAVDQSVVIPEASDESGHGASAKPLPPTPPLSPPGTCSLGPYPDSRSISPEVHRTTQTSPNLLKDLIEPQNTAPLPSNHRDAPTQAVARPSTLIPGLPSYRAHETYWDVMIRQQRERQQHGPIYMPCGHKCITCEEQAAGSDVSDDETCCNEHHCDAYIQVLWKVLILMALWAMLGALLFCLVKLGAGLIGVGL